MNVDTTARGGYEDDYQDGPERSLGDQLDIQHYLRILRKHKWPITLFTAAVTGLAAYYAFTATPIYRASATLLIEQQQLNVPTIEEVYGLESESSDYYETQFELLQSRNLAQKVVERLDLWDDPELSPAARTAAAQADAAQRTVVDDEPTGIVGRARDFLAGIGLVDDGARIAAADPVGLPAGSETPVDSGITLDLGGEAPVVLDPDASPEAAFAEENLPPGVSPEDAAFAALRNVDFGSSEPQLDPEQELVVGNFMSRLSVSPVRKTKLVNIGYESADPVKAARIANTVGDQYIKSYLDAKLEMTTMASEWLQGQLTVLKADLDEAEGRLIQYQQDNDLINLDTGVATLETQTILQLQSDLTQARADLSRLQSVYDEVQRLQDRPELLEAIPAIAIDPLVQNAKVDQGAVQRELDELLNRYGERHPSVVDKQSELDSVNATLAGHMRRVSASLAQDVEQARSRVNQLQGSLATSRGSITDIGGKSFGLDALEREVETKREIYNQFFNRLTEARSAEGLETANARISDYARPPTGPVKPKKQLIIALAALASLVLSMLMAFLYETMDDTVKSTNDIEGKLGLKLLGILPLIKTGLLKKTSDLPLNPENIPDKKGTFAEAVNTARTALCLDDGAEGRQVVVVTSSIPGEGKSTASINLAHSLGQLERVLLIDCDMRRPTIAKAAGLDRDTEGLANLIAGTASARHCIRRGVWGGGVDILPSGPTPDQPLELLSSKRFEKILESLRQHYDRIVIDSAPTQAVSDSLVLSRYADAVVYVVKSHDTSIELVRRGVQRLQQANANIAGALITQVDIDKITSYGGDYYYQGYYDYYGYNEDGERERKSGKIRLTQEELLAIKTDDRDVDLGLGADSDPYEELPRRRAGGPRRVEIYDEDDLGFDDPEPAPARRAPRGERRGSPTTVTRRRHADDDLDIL